MRLDARFSYACAALVAVVVAGGVWPARANIITPISSATGAVSATTFSSLKLLAGFGEISSSFPGDDDLGFGSQFAIAGNSRGATLEGLSARSSGNATNFGSAGSDASITGFYKVVETSPVGLPPATSSVPLNISAKLSVTLSLSGHADLSEYQVGGDALFQVYGLIDGGNLQNGTLSSFFVSASCILTSTLDSCTPAPIVSTAPSAHVHASPGLENKFVMDAMGGVNGIRAGGPDSNASATWAVKADPTIEIDPDFEFKDNFTVVFSPNLFVAASMPEPGSFALLVTALIALIAGSAVRSNARRYGRLPSL